MTLHFTQPTVDSRGISVLKPCLECRV